MYISLDTKVLESRHNTSGGVLLLPALSGAGNRRDPGVVCDSDVTLLCWLPRPNC
mgnify:CR=1 FL=1